MQRTECDKNSKRYDRDLFQMKFICLFVFGVCICSFCFSSSNLSSPFSAGNDLCKHALLSVIYTLILTQKQRSVTKQTSVFIIF